MCRLGELSPLTLMQHKAYILYNRNVTQSDSGIYCPHESSCHIQFIKELSIQGTGLAVCSKSLVSEPRYYRARPHAETLQKQPTCTAASLVTHLSPVCVMMSFIHLFFLHPPPLAPQKFFALSFLFLPACGSRWVGVTDHHEQSDLKEVSATNTRVFSAVVRLLRDFCLHQLICPSAARARVSTEVGIERQASVQRPNLLAAIDIPFSSVSPKLLCIQRLPAKPSVQPVACNTDYTGCAALQQLLNPLLFRKQEKRWHNTGNFPVQIF